MNYDAKRYYGRYSVTGEKDNGMRIYYASARDGRKLIRAECSVHVPEAEKGYWEIRRTSNDELIVGGTINH